MIRVQVEMLEDQVQKLDEIMEKCGIRTKKDLLNNALTLLKWAVKKKEAGCEIVAVNTVSGTYQELDMPVLSNVKRS